jgi:hypothetical protein
VALSPIIKDFREQNDGPFNSSAVSGRAFAHRHPARPVLALSGQEGDAMVSIIQTDILDDTADASSSSGVSWPAILAGAFVAAAASLVMLALGSGLGFAAISPWPGAGATAGAVTVMAGIWLILTQWAASGVGGYITGRLRTRWIGTHTHEVFFRDTAHGFVMWALATVVVVAVLVAAGMGAAKTVASASQAPYAYEIDSLFRPAQSGTPAATPAPDAEVGRIIANSLAKGSMADSDRAYLRDLAAARTGLSPAEAQARVDSLVATTRAAADKGRKDASAAALFTALSMLVGAFIACVAAALGGQQRDLHP